MKIAVIQSGLTGTGFWGGVLLTRDIATELSTRGHEIAVVEFQYERGPALTPLNGFTVHYLAPTRLRNGVNPLWAWQPTASDVATAEQFLASAEVDVVYGHMPYGNMAIYEAAIRLGVPVVQHVHDFATLCGRSFLVDAWGRQCTGPTAVAKCEACLRAGYAPVIRAGMRIASFPAGETLLRRSFGRRRTERFRLRQGIQAYFAASQRLIDGVRAWIVTGPPVRDVLCRYGVPLERIRLLPHGLPENRLVKAPPPPPLGGRPTRIGYFGRISAEKGVDLLAGVLRKLQTSERRPFEWWVISGSLPIKVRERLQSMAGLSGDRMRFIEGLRGSEINSALAQLDACVVPSLWPEIGPLTLLEALAQGVPCICNDAAGHAALIEPGRNGFRFRTGDATDLAAKLTLLLRDDSLVEQMRTGSTRIAGFRDFINAIEGILCDHIPITGRDPNIYVATTTKSDG